MKTKKLVLNHSFKIENMVASANLGMEIDLYTIASKVTNVEYEPEQFPAAVLKLKDPPASLLLFGNGKIICAGSKSEKDVKYALERAITLLTPYLKPLPVSQDYVYDTTEEIKEYRPAMKAYRQRAKYKAQRKAYDRRYYLKQKKKVRK